MPLVTEHTEETLADYMVRVIKGNAGILRWDRDSDDVRDAVNSTLISYFGDGGGSIDDATNTARLERLARVEIWRQVIEGYTTRIDLNLGASKIPRSTLLRNAETALKYASQRASARSGIRTIPIRYADDSDDTGEDDA